MGRHQIRDGLLRVQQQKTGSVLELPLHAALETLIDQTTPTGLTFLQTAYGRPFTAAGFGGWFRETCDEAGLPQCSAHGLRKAAARRLAEAGCSSHQIMAITGHRSLKEVDGYTAAANQRDLAKSALFGLSGGKTGT